MPFTPDMASVNQVPSTAPPVTLDITIPPTPPNYMLGQVKVTVNPGRPSEWSGNAPTSGGNFTALGFTAASGAPGTSNNVLITYKYMQMPAMTPCQEEEGHSFYLYV